MSVVIVLLLIGALIDTSGDIIMKKWASGGNYWIFASGLAVYLIGLVFLAFSYKYENIAVASIIFVIMNVVLLSVFTWIYFKEPLTGFQITGIILGIVAIVFLEYA